MNHLVWSPLPLHPRWSTVLMAALLLAVIGWRSRSPRLAVVATLAWLFGFEIIWQLGHGISGHVRFWDLNWFYWLAISGGWLAFAHHLGVRPELRLVAVAAALWAIWLMLGFNSNWPGQPISWTNEALNEASKTALGLAFLVGVLRDSRLGIGERADRPSGLDRVVVVSD